MTKPLEELIGHEATGRPPRERGRWTSCHELLRLDSLEAWQCKHCRSRFSHEEVEHSWAALPICPGPGEP